jgi:hypothetical protein
MSLLRAGSRRARHTVKRHARKAGAAYRAYRSNPRKKMNISAMGLGGRIYPVLYRNKRTGIIRHSPRARKYKHGFRVNPSLSLKGVTRMLTNKTLLINTFAGAAGFVGGGMGLGWIKRQSWFANNVTNDTVLKSIGVLNIVLGTALTMKGRKPALKAAGGGLAMSGAYDVLQKWWTSGNLPAIDAIALPSLPGAAATTPAAGWEMGSPAFPTGSYPSLNNHLATTISPAAGIELGGDMSSVESLYSM